MSDELGTYLDRLNGNSLQYLENFKPWKNTVTGKKSNIFFVWSFIHLIQTNEKLNNREDIAEALAKRKIFRQVKMIQTSSNIKFVSIEFDTFTTMETFRLERLSLKDNSLATFIKSPRNILSSTSWINVPSATDEQLLTDFFDQYVNL